MSEEVFRKKSLDRIKSPENLDDYIRVSNPSIWFLLISVVILLIGVCVWGIFGHIDSTVDAVVRVENGVAVCIVEEDANKDIAENMRVEFDGIQAIIEDIEVKENKKSFCILKTDVELKDGVYDGKLIIKSYKPLSFILN